jgi:glycerol-3-phosphate O-acyltransferase
MTATVAVPLWLALAGALVCAWFLASRLLLPGVRWFLRRRINRLTATLNRRLHLKIPPIAMTRREVLVDRLVYDPRVLHALTLYSETAGVPPEVALRQVRRYAREIVPAFNAYVYFSIGNRVARAIVNLIYRVRLGHAESRALRQIPPTTSVVFVMNHRSNIDYILVAYLASKRVALSYAAGEWARVWPIQQIVRALGAYFVRRGSGNDLYRRVLERYVQMAIEGGSVQAIFPEGGLTRDGLLRPPKIGLLDYMVRAFDPAGERDILFVPVGINYDRVLEDRTLLADDPAHAERRSGLVAVLNTLRFLGTQSWLRLRGRWYRFGYACANFGAPLSLKAHLARTGWNPLLLDRETRGGRVIELAAELMGAVGQVIPVLPVSLVARVFIDAAGEPLAEGEVKARSQDLQRHYESLGAQVYVPRGDPEYSVLVGLRMLTLRKLVIESQGHYHVNPDELAMLRYYANAIAHLAAPGAVPAEAATRAAR